MKSKLLFFLLLFVSAYTYAIKVTGIVYDENRETVIGANVRLKGSKSLGTITDLDGKFELNVPNVKEGVLVVSYIGYKTLNYPLNGRTIVEITLKPDVKELDEVVVVGYGAMRKSDLTGAVTSVEMSADEAMRASSFNKLLQGKAAGVTVSTGSAAPGGSVNVQIRGTSSLRGSNTPLYVVDGNIVSGMGDTGDPMSGGSGAGNSRADAQNPLAFLSPQDIESIEILKDASATAIYGSQGANGVIMITTKKGVTGRPSVNVSSNVSLSVLSRKIPVLNTEEFIDFHNSIEYIGEEGTMMTMDKLTPVDWQDMCTRVAVSHNYHASVSGKGNKSNYYLSMGYSNAQGIIKNTGVEKFDTRLNFNQDITDRLKLMTTTSFANVKTSMTSGTDKIANYKTSVVSHMVTYAPYKGLPTVAEDGSLIYNEFTTTPESWFTDYDDNSVDKTFSTNLTLDYKAFKWLTFRLKGGMTTKNKERSMWFGKQTFNGALSNCKAGISGIEGNFYNAELSALFNYRFNKKHNINGTVAAVYNNRSTKNTNINGEDFFTEEMRADGISFARLQYPYILNKSEEQLFSVLGRAVYSYNNRYVLTTTFRADGSSKFSEGNRFSFFPSFALAWRINQEKWMKSYKNISNFKLRLGWGQVGSQALASYQTVSPYYTSNYSTAHGTNAPGIVCGTLSNPNLKWETSEQYNLGIDFGMFDQRLSFTIDAYLKYTKDLLQQITMPYSSGYNKMWINNGKIENKGIEFSVNGTPIENNDWRWDVGANISFVKNKINSLGLTPSDFGSIKNVSGYWGQNVGNNTYLKFPANAFLEGQSIGLYMGYKTDGILQPEEYDANNPIMMKGAPIVPGDIKYVDQNGDRVIDDNDMVVLGNPNPDFTYAINSTLSYKKWTLDMAFTGVYGNELINANTINYADVANNNFNILRDAYFQAWNEENRSNTYPRLDYEQKGVLNDRIVEDGSYFKLSYVTVSYLLNLRKSKFIKSLSFSLTGSNLFTITSYSGYDPDVNTFAGNADLVGVDLASYPSSRTFSFGIMANF